MLFSNKYLGTSFSRSNYKGGMIYVKTTKYPVEVIMLENNQELPKEFICDYTKYFDIFVKNKVCLYNDNYKKFFINNEVLSKWL